jgi:hypothetical protein
MKLNIGRIRVLITKYGVPVGKHSYASVEEYERALKENDNIENIVITTDYIEYELKTKNLDEEI